MRLAGWTFRPTSTASIDCLIPWASPTLNIRRTTIGLERGQISRRAIFQRPYGWPTARPRRPIFFNPLAIPVAARAALWAGDLAGARAALDVLVAKQYRGRALSLDKATIRAGIAALEGRGADALTGYRDVLRGWRQIGCAFDEALAVIDMATLLHPTDADSVTEIEWARETLRRLGARPYLDRLEAAVAGEQGEKPAASSKSVPVKA